MKTSKLISFLLAAVLTLGLVAGCGNQKQEEPQKEAAAPQKTLVMAINATFPPFESVKVDDKGKQAFVGIDIDIAEYIAEKLNVKLEIQDMAFNGLVTAVSSGRADLCVSGISPTAERLKVIDFSEPYFYPQTGILALKGSNYPTLASLEGKKIGVSMGTTYANQAASVKDAKVVELDNTPLVVQEIVNNRIDAGIFDGSQAVEFMKENKNLELHLLPAEMVKEDSYAIALPKNSPYKDQINQILEEMKKNGKMEEIFTKWLGESYVSQKK
ncbi:ABC transporter substrate-binding protein [Desulforamulus aeronauticus]|uniref:Polar amino acid transport system substrate-binding protein n=1 Tax=Desulforamulus aeronauticus DSM 10349 TaxID=1121421 RepID=A0A1M6TV08_9FIRM|nr:ABC transporter substrate-binding protein [Desulforamulus aeronauticus]SHK60842.1 polar amino acid transport system substrate-binding protein [Desulforamulus aeronauticus DSM 10349]